jgi:hypothetical protein
MTIEIVSHHFITAPLSVDCVCVEIDGKEIRKCCGSNPMDYAEGFVDGYCHVKGIKTCGALVPHRQIADVEIK